MIFFPLDLSLGAPFCGFDKSSASPEVCFFRFGTPISAALPIGPDQAWNGSFEQVYEVVVKETSVGTVSGSI